MAKIITFFNEKGGTGKTLFTALFSSWLSYHKHEQVLVFDMDYPMHQLYNIREKDKDIVLKMPKSPFAQMAGANLGHYYPIGKAGQKTTFTQSDLEYIEKFLRRQSAMAPNAYILIDFPGRYLETDPVYYLSSRGILDYVIFPIDSDTQSRASALSTYHKMREVYCGPGKGQKAAFLWNREAQKERVGKRDWYAEPNRLFERMGIEVIGTKVRDILIARRDASTFGFIRNTLCWPEQNVAKACGYIDTVFEEIKLRIDGKWNEQTKNQLYGSKKTENSND